MKQKKQGLFTLIELLVVIAIIGILASLLLPALSQAKAVGRNVLCINAEKNISTLSFMYAEDWSEILPHRGGKSTWPGVYYWLSSTYEPIHKFEGQVKLKTNAAYYRREGTSNGWKIIQASAFHCPEHIRNFPIQYESATSTLCSSFRVRSDLGGYTGTIGAVPKLINLKPNETWWAEAQSIDASGVTAGCWQNNSWYKSSDLNNNNANKIPWSWRWKANGISHPGGTSNFIYGDGHVNGIPQQLIDQ